jgi:hypothetical protein
MELLPLEVIEIILEHLSVNDILRLARVCSKFPSIVRDWDLWARRAKRDYGIPGKLFRDTSWSCWSHPAMRYRQASLILPDDALLRGIHLNDVSTVKWALFHGAKHVHWALFRVAKAGDPEIARELISAGATNIDPALVEASKSGHDTMVDFLMSAGTKNLTNALTWAAIEGHVSIVKRLIAAGAREIRWECDHQFNAGKLVGAIDMITQPELSQVTLGHFTESRRIYRLYKIPPTPQHVAVVQEFYLAGLLDHL